MVCVACGFDWRQPPAAAIDIISDTSRQIATALDGGREVVTCRPTPSTWSVLEYAAHLGDVLSWYAERLERIQIEDRAQFSAFDWDAACEERQYIKRRRSEVITAIDTSADRCVAALHMCTAIGWSGIGVGSDGTLRTPASQALRAAHEVVHHLYDIRDVARRVRLGSATHTQARWRRRSWGG
jgi:DinB superfamily